MDKDPTNSLENNNNENASDGVLGQMPSYAEFRKMREQGDFPEDIRDEQDYKEYMEEQKARIVEKEEADQEAAAEKMEKIGTFEKRLEMNKKLYDDVAYQRACRLAADKGSYEDYYNRKISEQIYLLEGLYDGVVDDDIEESSIVQWDFETTNGENVDTGEIVLPKRGEDTFKDAFSKFAFDSLIMPEDEIIDKRAKEMMDTSKFEEGFDDFLNERSENISSYDIDYIENEIHDLNDRSDYLFGFIHDGGYTSSTLNEKTAIIPTLESRIRLEEQVILIKEKIANIIAEVKSRELQADLRESVQGRRVSSRLENKQ